MRLLLRGLRLTAVGAVLLARSVAYAEATAPEAAVERFLMGIGSSNLAERQQLLTDLVWQAASIERPAFIEAVTVREGVFETDIDGVQGYECVARLTVPLRSGARLTRTFRIVAYADRVSRRWRVWSFGEGGDSDSGLAFWRDQATRASLAAEPDVTMRYAQALGSSGRLQEALDLYLYFVDSYREDPGSTTAVAQSAEALRSLRRIIGSPISFP